MDEAIKKERAAALREKKREERNGRTGIGQPDQPVSGSGESVGSVSGLADPAPGTTLQNAGRASKRLTPTGGPVTGGDRRNRGDGSSFERESGRPGRVSGRDKEDDGGAPSDPATAEQGARKRVGRLETDESVIVERPLQPDKPEASFAERQDGPIPAGPRYKEDFRRTHRGKETVYAHNADASQVITPDEYKSLASRKDAEQASADGKEKPRLFKAGNVLTEQEVKDLYEPYCAVIGDIAHYADEAIWLRATQIDGEDIWGNLDADETSLIAHTTLNLGQRSPMMATAIRQAVVWHDYAALAAIIVPRTKRTVQVLRAAPPLPRKKRSIFRKAENV